ncbi:MAG: cadmium-translocating P-type ATPase [Sphingobacteriales bacterium]|nr:MAG: cadmium-translocating P-type ATPase [Sphingobacteriales bacterium]
MSKECCGDEQQPRKKGAGDNKINPEEILKPSVEGAYEPQDDDEEILNLQEAGEEETGWRGHWPLLTAFFILLVMLLLEFGFKMQPPFPYNLTIFAVAYLLAGYNVLGLAWRKAKRFDFFNEFFLMSVATLGAFSIGAYSEGVAVMVFYSIGEWFQDAAVDKAKRSIKALLDVRPDQVTVIRDGKTTVVNPWEVNIDEVIQVKAGEKVALDGELYTDVATLNTAALTGESKPDTRRKGEQVLAGMINLDKVSEVQVKSLFKDSKLSKILEMVQDATARKSQTQLFISKFAKIYTPIVFALALLVCLAPYFFIDDYNFHQWFYRSLVFLVISCPCALVVSIPLGYFGGIGLASRNGILFKGSNFLDVMTQINTVIMDKTGTLTKGVFKVQEVVADSIDQDELIRFAAAIESNSTHPIAKAVVEYAGDKSGDLKAENVEEIAGHGLKGTVNGKTVLAGNAKLLNKFNMTYHPNVDKLVDTVVVIAIDKKYAGYIIIADEIKEDAKEAVDQMHRLNIQTVMLSGDKQAVVNKVAKLLGIDKAFGDLLPDGSALWLDGGHNPAAAEAVSFTVAQLAEGRPVRLVLGMLANKDAQGLLAPFARLAQSLHAVPVPGHEHHAPTLLAHVAQTLGIPHAAPAPDLSAALSDIARQGGAPVVLILGSLYLAGVALAANGELPN